MSHRRLPFINSRKFLRKNRFPRFGAAGFWVPPSWLKLPRRRPVIQDHSSDRIWHIKGTEESSLVTHLADLLMDHDSNDLRSLILIHITLKERALRSLRGCYTVGHVTLLYAANFVLGWFFFGGGGWALRDDKEILCGVDDLRRSLMIKIRVKYSVHRLRSLVQWPKQPKKVWAFTVNTYTITVTSIS